MPGSWLWADTGEAIEFKVHPLPGDFLAGSLRGDPGGMPNGGRRAGHEHTGQEQYTREVRFGGRLPEPTAGPGG